MEPNEFPLRASPLFWLTTQRHSLAKNAQYCRDAIALMHGNIARPPACTGWPSPTRGEVSLFLRWGVLGWFTRARPRFPIIKSCSGREVQSPGVPGFRSAGQDAATISAGASSVWNRRAATNTSFSFRQSDQHRCHQHHSQRTCGRACGNRKGTKPITNLRLHSRVQNT